jgi:carboxymethylenebutenolidase
MGKMINRDSNDEKFEAYVAEPAGEIRAGVIVIHEIWALNDHTKSVADRLAAEGYLALAPNLLSMLELGDKAAQLQLQSDMFNPEKRNEAQPKLRALMTPMQDPDFGSKTMAKLQVCFDELYNRPAVGQKVAVMGFCFGGSYSFGLAAHEPRLKLALPFYGHTTTDVEELKQIKCPIRAFYGENDENLITALPSVEANMKTAGVDFEAKVYSGARHAFFNDTNPYAYNAAAANDGWSRALDYLKTYLV